MILVAVVIQDGGGAVRGGPVPELAAAVQAAAVVAPALYRAAREQGARVALAHSEVRRRRDAGHVDGGGALGGGSVTELAVVVRDDRFHEIIRTGDSNT